MNEQMVYVAKSCLMGVLLMTLGQFPAKPLMLILEKTNPSDIPSLHWKARE